MRKLVSSVLLTVSVASALFFAPATAEAHARLVCKRVWYRGHLVRRCRHVPAPRHHNHQRPPTHRATYV